MNVLALDLGTKTGYAYSRGSDFMAGTWTLAKAKQISEARRTRMDRRCDPRIWQLHSTLLAYVNRADIVVFEDVQFSSTTMQTQLWASLRAAVWIAFCHPSIIIECVPVGTLKKFATGHGGATKEMMKAACKRLGYSTDSLDDNAIDAIFLHRWAQQYLCRK